MPGVTSSSATMHSLIMHCDLLYKDVGVSYQGGYAFHEIQRDGITSCRVCLVNNNYLHLSIRA